MVLHSGCPVHSDGLTTFSPSPRCRVRNPRREHITVFEDSNEQGAVGLHIPPARRYFLLLHVRHPDVNLPTERHRKGSLCAGVCTHKWACVGSEMERECVCLWGGDRLCFNTWNQPLSRPSLHVRRWPPVLGSRACAPSATPCRGKGIRVNTHKQAPTRVRMQ